MVISDDEQLQIPTREESVLRYILEQRVAESPDEVFVIFQQTDEAWTRREFLDRTQCFAAALQKLGVHGPSASTLHGSCENGIGLIWLRRRASAWLIAAIASSKTPAMKTTRRSMAPGPKMSIKRMRDQAGHIKAMAVHNRAFAGVD